MPATDPLLHVGFHKTGTTWLQARLFTAEHGFFSRGHPAHFAWRFLPRKGKGMEHPYDFDAAAIRRDWETETAAAPVGARPVISNEDLLNHVYNGGNLAPLIAGRLREVFPDARVLITIRDQPNLIRSAYEHFMLGGGVCGIDAFLQPLNEYQIPFFDPEHLHYDRAIAHYRALFGTDNVLVLPHEMLTRAPEAFITALMEFAGLPALGPDRVAEITGGRVNTFDPRQAAVVRWLRWVNLVGAPTNQNARAGMGHEKLCRAILWYAAKATPAATAKRSRGRLLDRIRAAVGERYAESNRRTMAMTGLDLAALGYAVKDPQGADAPAVVAPETPARPAPPEAAQ